MATVHASVAGGGIQGAATSCIIKLDAVGFGRYFGVGDVDLELCYGSFQFYGFFGFLPVGTNQLAVLIKGVG